MIGQHARRGPAVCHTALAVATVLGLLVAPTTEALAGGYTITEFGSRRTGMAAVVGRPDDPSAVVHNPAGLVLLPGIRGYGSFGLAVIGTQFDLQSYEQSSELLGVEPGGDGYYDTVRPNRAAAAIPMLGVTVELLEGRLYGGLSLYVSNATGSSFDEDAVTQYHLIEGSLIGPLGSASLAYAINDKVAVGASFGMTNLRLHARRRVFPVVNGNDVSSVIGNRAELVVDGSDWVPTWNLGTLVRPTPYLSLGAAVTSRSNATLAGPVALSYMTGAGVAERLEGTHRTSYMIPWSAAAGVNVDVTPNLELGSEVRYWRYSDFEEQRSEIDGIILVDELVVEKDFEDSYQVSGGARLHSLAALPGLELMLGAHFDKTPAPEERVSLDQPTFSNIGLHTGARYKRGRYQFGLTYVRLAYLVPTVTTSMTSPPSNFRGSGAANIITTSIEVAFDSSGLSLGEK